MKFEPIVENADLDIHPSPDGLWSRCAIICRWKDAHTFRKQWPEAAVVGPLRTLRGIDDLVRNLLHNPRIRTVVLDGVDLTPDAATTRALFQVWEGFSTTYPVGEDLLPYLDDLVSSVRLVTKAAFLQEHGILGVSMADRPGGKISLPPPPPKAEAPSPHGDPGERVVGDTLAEVWPQVLHRAMRFGRILPTQYGDTREVMDLVSVIRDPKGSIQELDPGVPHPVLGISGKEAEAYFERVTGKEAPEGALYSYGSRMHGTDLFESEVDQFEKIEALLTDKPGTRAAFLTPWIPVVDAGLEAGRPCLVGAWFRIVDD